MTRILLRMLNAPGLILLTFFAIAIQTSLFGYWPLTFLQPDAILIVVIWCGLRRKFTEGGVITLLIANAAEAHSAVPQGLFLILYMTVYLGIRGFSRMFVIPNFAALITVTLFTSAFWRIAETGLLQLLDANDVGLSQWRHALLFLCPMALIEGALGIVLYQWLEKFDRLTFKNARDEHALENDLLLDEEGI